MTSAAIRAQQAYAFAHPLVEADDPIRPGHSLRLDGGTAVLLTLNR